MCKLNPLILFLSPSWLDGFSSEKGGTLARISYEGQSSHFIRSKFLNFLPARKKDQRWLRFRSGNGIALWKTEKRQKRSGRTFEKPQSRRPGRSLWVESEIVGLFYQDGQRVNLVHPYLYSFKKHYSHLGNTLAVGPARKLVGCAQLWLTIVASWEHQ